MESKYIGKTNKMHQEFAQNIQQVHEWKEKPQGEDKIAAPQSSASNHRTSSDGRESLACADKNRRKPLPATHTMGNSRSSSS